VLLDRSWYNRAGVERVMGFCTPQEYLEFMRQSPELERMITRSDTLLIKFWLSISQNEQFHRLQARQQDPLKQWKISELIWLHSTSGTIILKPKIHLGL